MQASTQPDRMQQLWRASRWQLAKHNPCRRGMEHRNLTCMCSTVRRSLLPSGQPIAPAYASQGRTSDLVPLLARCQSPPQQAEVKEQVGVNKGPGMPIPALGLLLPQLTPHSSSATPSSRRVLSLRTAAFPCPWMPCSSAFGEGGFQLAPPPKPHIEDGLRARRPSNPREAASIPEFPGPGHCHQPHGKSPRHDRVLTPRKTSRTIA